MLVSFQKLMYIFLFFEKVRVQGQYKQQIMNVVIFCCCKCKITTFIYLLKDTLYFDYPFIICSIKVTYILLYYLFPILKSFFIYSQLDALSKHTFFNYCASFVLRSKTKEAQSWLRIAQQLLRYAQPWFDPLDPTIISDKNVEKVKRKKHCFPSEHHGEISLLTCPAVFVRDPTMRLERFITYENNLKKGTSLFL
jgi:hypothetical protein